MYMYSYIKLSNTSVSKCKYFLWCFLFYKENVTLLQEALKKKLLTNPVIM